MCSRSFTRTWSPPSSDYTEPMLGLELFFLGLLGLATLAIAFTSVVVLVNLYRGQR